MHEFFLSSSIARRVLQEAKKRKVLSLHLEIGELTFLNPEQVKFWLRELFRGTPAEKAKIKIKKIPPFGKCSSCGYRGEIKPPLESFSFHLFSPPLFCPKCGARLKIERGKDCLLRRIQLLK